MTPFLDGYVRARQTERALAASRPVAEATAPARGVRYRVGRRLVAIGAHMMRPEPAPSMPEWGDTRRAA